MSDGLFMSSYDTGAGTVGIDVDKEDYVYVSGAGGSYNIWKFENALDDYVWRRFVGVGGFQDIYCSRA